jgi:hypothetical protein
VVSGATEVLKVQTLLVARALPARSVTVVLTVAVNEVLVGSGDGLTAWASGPERVEATSCRPPAELPDQGWRGLSHQEHCLRV